MTTRVLGVDPGLTRCGVGVILAGASRKVSLVSVDTIRTDASSELVDRIGHIGEEIEKLILNVKPSAIAIERVFSQQNLRSVMGVAQISGVVFMLAHKHAIPVFLHTPSEVKAAVTGSGRANKQQVGQMVAKILGLEEVPKPADAADSLAIAICHAWKSVGGTVSSSSEMTSAQKAWQAAEQNATASKRR
ncbi:crossover junction endodeoxyribonuclease RuvC [Rhodoluna lacicola]|uniref:crossover junction endodeoxyribonuclease RuvC n=1 Tax=Rhodoluna lacicola TaxID=529884 RepID=UPI00222F6130|nr:crossover junction endodeoxyribonuclease RuvC [Rhodoluna lacicola]BDS50415.1 crossover junction endodeoxyribonuclease RuvC [Rhodoluna lacicola]